MEQAEEEKKTGERRREELCSPSTNTKTVPPAERWMFFAKEKELVGCFQGRKKKQLVDYLRSASVTWSTMGVHQKPENSGYARAQEGKNISSQE